MASEIDVDSVQESTTAQEAAPAAPTGKTEEAEQPSEDDLDEVLRLMGVSVHYLETTFLKEVEAAGLDRTATISQLEGLEIVVEESMSVIQEQKAAAAQAAAQEQAKSAVTDADAEAKEEITEDGKGGDASVDIRSVEDLERPSTPKRDNTHKEEEDEIPPPVILNKGADVLCPIDGKTGAAYVHCLLNTEGDSPVGFANVFLIYANQYTIGDILDTLGDYCATTGEDPKETFVWMYCFSTNLHRIPQISKEENFYYASGVALQEIEAKFDRIKRQILNIGHVMILLSPWKDPLLLKRCWCTLELYAAQDVIKEQIREQQEPTIDVSVVFPPSQKMDLEINLLLEDNKLVLDAFYKMLGSIKVQNADCALHQDRNGILKFVEENTGGKPHYNLQCNQVTRQWYRALKQEMENLPQHTIPQKYPLKPLTLLTTDALAQQYAAYFEQLAILFENNDEVDAAGEMHMRAETIRDCMSTDNPQQQQQQLVPDKPLTYYNAATRLAEQQDWDGAILALGKTMAIYEAAFGNQHIATGTVYYRIGDMLLSKSRMGIEPAQSKQGAMIAYKRALDVQEAKLGKYHPVTCANYIQLGLYLEARGKFDDALEYYTNGQALLGQDVPIATKPFLTLEKKFLLKGQDDAANLARQKGQAIRDAIGIEENSSESESESDEEGGSNKEDGRERREGAKDEDGSTKAAQQHNDDEKDKDMDMEPKEEAIKKPAPMMMEDLDDEDEDAQEGEDDENPETAPKPEVQDLLAEYRRTLAQVQEPDATEAASEAASDDDDKAAAAPAAAAVDC